MKAASTGDREAMKTIIGVNGACGVFASVGAVAVSMWFGIHRNLWVAASAYVLVAWTLWALQQRLAAREH